MDPCACAAVHTHQFALIFGARASPIDKLDRVALEQILSYFLDLGWPESSACFMIDRPKSQPKLFRALLPCRVC